MAIHIIIDGYNLIRQSSELAGLDRQSLQLGREALVDLLAAYKRRKPHKITVVFDGCAEPTGYSSRDRLKGIAITYSQGGERADDVIRRMAQQERAKALVVSSDRAVMAAAEYAGATVMDAAAFEYKMALAHSLMVNGGQNEADSDGWVSGTRKKGPSRRLSKRKRKVRTRLEKL